MKKAWMIGSAMLALAACGGGVESAPEQRYSISS